MGEIASCDEAEAPSATVFPESCVLDSSPRLASDTGYGKPGAISLVLSAALKLGASWGLFPATPPGFV